MYDFAVDELGSLRLGLSCLSFFFTFLAYNGDVENAGLENEGPNRMGGKSRTGKHENGLHKIMDSET